VFQGHARLMLPGMAQAALDVGGPV
jgi:hypothetical protein